MFQLSKHEIRFRLRLFSLRTVQIYTGFNLDHLHSAVLICWRCKSGDFVADGLKPTKAPHSRSRVSCFRTCDEQCFICSSCCLIYSYDQRWLPNFTGFGSQDLWRDLYLRKRKAKEKEENKIASQFFSQIQGSKIALCYSLTKYSLLSYLSVIVFINLWR